MKKPRWYSPQLSREIVSKLYFKAKAERIPMTWLANRIMEKALDTDPIAECRRDAGSHTHTHSGIQGGAQKARSNQQPSHQTEEDSDTRA
jgi:hypothetical protein